MMTWRAQYLDDLELPHKAEEHGSYDEPADGIERDGPDEDGFMDDGGWPGGAGQEGKFYSFPDLGMSTGLHKSYIEARKAAEEAVWQLEADGDIFDPFTRSLNRPETEPYYDDGRPEGYHGHTPKDYRWRDMYKYYKKVGRKLTREETDSFEVNPLYETDWEGNKYDRKAMVAYAWKMKRQLKPKEYDMFLINDDGTDTGSN